MHEQGSLSFSRETNRILLSKTQRKVEGARLLHQKGRKRQATKKRESEREGEGKRQWGGTEVGRRGGDREEEDFQGTAPLGSSRSNS